MAGRNMAAAGNANEPARETPPYNREAAIALFCAPAISNPHQASAKGMAGILSIDQRAKTKAPMTPRRAAVTGGEEIDASTCNSLKMAGGMLRRLFSRRRRPLENRAA